MTITKKLKSELNEKECFMLWYELGTLRKVANNLEARGIVNPVTNRPYSKMAIYNAAMRWVFDHPEEAWPYYQAAGTNLTKPMWEEWLVKTAIIQLFKISRRGFVRWVRKNGYEAIAEQYENITGEIDYSKEI